MRSLTAPSTAAVLAAYDFGRFGTIVDVGGGNGTLLASLLAAHPSSAWDPVRSGTRRRRRRPVLTAAGVADRCEIVAGSFFENVPGGGDAYVLKSIIHDWEDEESVAILSACRARWGLPPSRS